MLGISVFEKLEDDVRVVNRFSLIRESGDQAFGIESCADRAGKTRCGDVGEGGRQTEFSGVR